MPTYLLAHRHGPDECGSAFAAWRGFDSPLRAGTPLAGCLRGEHCVWWTVEAPGADAALALLPPYVAARTVAVEVRPVALP